MRVVIDTSVWVSALLSPESNARRVLEVFLDERFVLIYNRETLLELRDVSKRPKFKGKIAARQWTALERKIRTLGEPIGITQRAETSDPKDDYLLEIALSGDADALVTLDGVDLLSITHIKKPKIINAGQFLKMLGFKLKPSN